MSGQSSYGSGIPPNGLADRIALYLDDAPHGGGHSDAAGSNSWELLQEAMDVLRAPAQPSPRCVVCGSGDTMTICEGCWTRQPDQAVDRLREALTLGRDAVMESFEYVKSNDDQLMADARLQSIDAALAGLPSVTSTESLPPDWKQDQAETSRLAPRVSSTGGGTAA